MIVFQNETVVVFQSSLYQTTSTMIDAETSLLLIDPGWLPEEVCEIQSYVAAIRRGRPLYLLFTHSDFDHIIGYGAFPDAVVIASAAFTNHPAKDFPLKQIHDFDKKYYLKRSYPILYPEVECAVANDGETMKIGNRMLTFYLAPGHTNDGLVTVIEPGGILVAGDHLSDVEFPFIFDNYESYQKTINKIKKIIDSGNIELLIPGHGSVTNSMEDIQQRVNQSIHYLQSLKQSEDCEDALREQYEFFEGMKDTHLHNVREAAKKEK
ncbi:MBL fold metallo-hydrolase [Peribacillus sp. FSL H8-0477]|uniref:MBL fold metallo-hydrolase n=1 Tax=Peribacillus sp. FSL H8-0477 TaxID=2921388 RepID=UPI0030F84492